MRAAITTIALLCASVLEAQRTIDLSGAPQHTHAEAFTQIAGVRALPGGAVIVTDQMERRVFLVNLATGAHEQIGREGSGPGEYRFPTQPFAAPNANTWILDASLRRVLALSSTGRFQQSIAAPYAAVPGGIVAAFGTDRAGRLYFVGNSFDSETGNFSDSVGIVRWDPASNRAEILGRVWSGGRVRVERPTGVASLARAITPFPEVDAWVALPDGRVAIVEQRPHRIRFIGAGPITLTAELPYTRVDVTAAERAAYRAREEGARMVAAGGSGGVAGRRPATTDAEFPASMPPFIASSVIASPEGDIWVGRSFAHTARTRHYDIYSGTGQRVATATLRSGSSVVGFGAGTVLIARTDPDDHLVYLETYRR